MTSPKILMMHGTKMQNSPTSQSTPKVGGTITAAEILKNIDL